MADLVLAIRTNAEFRKSVEDEMRRLDDLAKTAPRRMEACWISRTTRETLTAALAAANKSPGVPAGG